MSELRGRSRKHKLPQCLRGDGNYICDSQDITSDGTCSNRACNSWEDSDEINTYFCHQLSSLSIPTSSEHPRKKLKRRKTRKLKRTRVIKPVTVNSMSDVNSDVTPTSPASSHMISIASDDTLLETMSVGECSSDSSLSFGHASLAGGTDADDELSCWEGPGTFTEPPLMGYTGHDVMITDPSGAVYKRKVSQRDSGDVLSVNTTPSGLRRSPIKPIVRRGEKLKSRQRSDAANEHGHAGSSTSSPSMDSVMRRRAGYNLEYIHLVDGAGPSGARSNSFMGE